MKIALLVPGGVDRSGTHRVIPCLLWLIERLSGAGHEVHVFATRQEDRPGSWPLLGATVHNVARRPATPWMLRAVVAEHRRGRFDVIHAFWSALGAVGAVAGKLLRVPLVVTLPGGDVVGLADIEYGALLSRRGRLDLRLVARCAADVNTPSRFMRDLAAGSGLHVTVVPLGVDLAAWPPIPPRPRKSAGPVRLLHVASLNRVKDQTTLLKALARLKASRARFEAILIGCDTLGGEIQHLANLMGLASEVRFLGELTHPELRPWFEQADLLVVSSRHEAGQMVTLEAAVAGVPTVGTHVGHTADLAPEAAAAVPVGDWAALGEEIGQLASDDKRRLRLAAAAQAIAVRNDADFTARSFLEIYRKVAIAPVQGDEPKGLCDATTEHVLRGSGRMRGWFGSASNKRGS